MSSPNLKYLDYEIALLLARHGRSAVLRALSRKFNMTPEELESQLQALPVGNDASRLRKRASSAEQVEHLLKQHPEKAEVLRALFARFERRSLMPELRDVKRFFELHNRPQVAAKSRVEAAPKLFRLLADLGLPELQALLDEESPGSYSSLGVISDEILGHRR